MKRALVVLAVLSVSAFGQTNISPSLPGDVLPLVLEDYLGFVPAPPHVVLVAQDQTNSVVAAWNVTNAIPADWSALCSATNYSAAIGRIAARVAPTEFPNGIAIPDSSATNPVYEIGVENGAPVAWVVHASPYDPAVAESNRVSALAERSTLRADLRLLKGVAQTNKAQVRATTALPATYTDAENRALVNDLRRELIDANDTIIELTRLVRKLLKEQNP